MCAYQTNSEAYRTNFDNATPAPHREGRALVFIQNTTQSTVIVKLQTTSISETRSARFERTTRWENSQVKHNVPYGRGKSRAPHGESTRVLSRWTPVAKGLDMFWRIQNNLTLKVG